MADFPQRDRLDVVSSIRQMRADVDAIQKQMLALDIKRLLRYAASRADPPRVKFGTFNLTWATTSPDSGNNNVTHNFGVVPVVGFVGTNGAYGRIVTQFLANGSTTTGIAVGRTADGTNVTAGSALSSWWVVMA